MGKKYFDLYFHLDDLTLFSTYQIQSNDNESHTTATRVKEINPNVSREKKANALGLIFFSIC